MFVQEIWFSKCCLPFDIINISRFCLVAAFRKLHTPPITRKIILQKVHISLGIQWACPIRRPEDLYLKVWIFGKDRLDACHPGLGAPTMRRPDMTKR